MVTVLASASLVKPRNHRNNLVHRQRVLTERAARTRRERRLVGDPIDEHRHESANHQSSENGEEYDQKVHIRGP